MKGLSTDQNIVRLFGSFESIGGWWMAAGLINTLLWFNATNCIDFTSSAPTEQSYPGLRSLFFIAVSMQSKAGLNSQTLSTLRIDSRSIENVTPKVAIDHSKNSSMWAKIHYTSIIKQYKLGLRRPVDPRSDKVGRCTIVGWINSIFRAPIIAFSVSNKIWDPMIYFDPFHLKSQ